MSRVQGVPLDSYLKRIQACKSQDSAGGIGRILRVVPNTESPCCRDRLPTQIPVPISAAESWDLQPLPLGQWKFECKVVALSVLCPHPPARGKQARSVRAPWFSTEHVRSILQSLSNQHRRRAPR